MAILSAARALRHVVCSPAAVNALTGTSFLPQRSFGFKAGTASTLRLEFRDWGVLWSGGLGLAVGLLLSTDLDDKNENTERQPGPATSPVARSSDGGVRWSSPVETSSWLQALRGLLSLRVAEREDVSLDLSKLSCKVQGEGPGQNRQPIVLVSCGSFNPPTNMHLRMFHLAAHHLQGKGWDVWGGYMSPVNDNYRKPGLVPAPQRVQMCEAAASVSPLVMVDGWESQQQQYVRTLHVLQRIQRCLHDHLPSTTGEGVSSSGGRAGYNQGGGAGDEGGRKVRVALLCGADLVASMVDPKAWLQPLLRELLASHGLVCITRGETSLDELLQKEGTLLNEFKDNIIQIPEHIPNVLSSTLIRTEVQQGRPIDFLTPAPVVDYIKRHKLYLEAPGTSS